MIAHSSVSGFEVDHAMALALGADAFPIDATHVLGSEMDTGRLLVSATAEPPTLTCANVHFVRERQPASKQGQAPLESYYVKRETIMPSEDGTRLIGFGAMWASSTLEGATGTAPEGVELYALSQQTIDHVSGRIGRGVAAVSRANSAVKLEQPGPQS